MEIIYIILGLALYFLPTIIGWKVKGSSGIFMLNLFLGWTLLGWIAALIWAATAESVKKSWKYECSKCSYETELTQRVKMHICPQCQTQNNWNLD